MIQKNELTRRISLEDDFMHHERGNDLAYGFMLYLATYDEKTNTLYLTKNRLEKDIPIMRAILGDITKKGVLNAIAKLLENNLIKESKINIGSMKNVPCYTFPYTSSSRYQLISNDVLYYVLFTRNKCAVRIYTYLYNKYLWKQQTGEEYEFTIKEIKLALGWSNTTKTAEDLINMNLRSLKNEGIIDYVEYFRTINSTPSPVKRLTFVAAKQSQIMQRGFNRYEAI